MNSAQLSFEDAPQDTPPTKERSVFDFCGHVLMFLFGFILITIVVFLVIEAIYTIVYRCPVSQTYPLDHGKFLSNTTLQRQGPLP